MQINWPYTVRVSFENMKNSRLCKNYKLNNTMKIPSKLTGIALLYMVGPQPRTQHYRQQSWMELSSMGNNLQ